MPKDFIEEARREKFYQYLQVAGFHKEFESFLFSTLQAHRREVIEECIDALVERPKISCPDHKLPDAVCGTCDHITQALEALKK